MSVKVRRKRQRVTSGSMGITGYSSLASILALMYQGPSSERARSRAPSRGLDVPDGCGLVDATAYRNLLEVGGKGGVGLLVTGLGPTPRCPSR